MEENKYMHCSMTGYGKGISEKDGLKFIVEMKSVNHRFLDLYIRTPKSYMFAEDIIRNSIKQEIYRGHFDIFLNIEDNRKGRDNLVLDKSIALAYINAGKEIASMIGDGSQIKPAAILSMPDVMRANIIEEDSDLIEELVTLACDKAVSALQAMRYAEGKNLVVDIESKIESLERIVQEMGRQIPRINDDFRQLLSTKLYDALKDESISPGRIDAEISMFIDKTCIDEEITRLNSHIKQYGEILNFKRPIGKKLDFLTQETNREVNTIASKSSDIALTKLALDAKSIVEAIREQVQNLE